MELIIKEINNGIPATLYLSGGNMRSFLLIRWCLFITSFFILFSDIVRAEKLYIWPPSNYKHLKNSSEDKVYLWMQGQPTHRSHNDLTIPSPYSFEQWIQQGREMEGTEQILLSFYENYTGQIQLASILDALQYIATFKSVIPLLNIVKDDMMDDMDRSAAVLVLGKIGTPDAVEPLISLVEKANLSDLDPNQQEFTLIFNSIGVLADIGDPRAIPAMQHFLNKANLSVSKKEYVNKLMHTVNNRRCEYVADWILRWHLGNKQKNSKELPYFISKKKWVAAGKAIPEIDTLLIDLFNRPDRSISKDSILYAMGSAGSNKNVEFLASIAVKEKDCCKEAVAALKELKADAQIQSLITMALQGTVDKNTRINLSDSILNVYSDQLTTDQADGLKKVILDNMSIGLF